MFRRRHFAIYLAIAIIVLMITQYKAQQPHLPISARIPTPSSKIAASNRVQHQWRALPTIFPISSQALLPLPTGRPKHLPQLQYEFTQEASDKSTQRKKRRAAVRETFRKCWTAYKKHAWMHDELLPLSAGFNDKLGGWSATLIENLDTLWIMELESEFQNAVNAVMTIDTRVIKTELINVKRTTIRHLGGLLAAYDLSGETRLLEKACEFGEMLLKTFDTPNHLPVTRWDWESALSGVPQHGSDRTLLAEIGSLSLEFTRLSQLTGDPRWFSAVHNITLLFRSQLSNSVLPGMFPVLVGTSDKLDVRANTSFTLNKWADSFYEYLPKMYLLLGGLEPVYGDLFATTMTTAIEHTIFTPMTQRGEDIVFPGTIRVTQSSTELIPNIQHLGCYSGGMFALGGKIFGNDAHLEIATKLTNGCIWAYQKSASGMMAEEFYMVPCPTIDICSWNESRYREEIIKIAGDVDVDTYIRDSRLREGVTSFKDTRFHLRPEAIESIFLMYRMTGNITLQEIAWKIFQSIMNATTTQLANAALLDVTYTLEELAKLGSDQRFDSMESFWLTETLKYFYLIFSEPDLISLDEFVFNTEGHPLARPISV